MSASPWHCDACDEPRAAAQSRSGHCVVCGAKLRAATAPTDRTDAPAGTNSAGGASGPSMQLRFAPRGLDARGNGGLSFTIPIPTPTPASGIAENDGDAAGEEDPFMLFDGIFGAFPDELRESLRQAMIGSSPSRPISNDYLKTIGRIVVDARRGILYDMWISVGPFKALVIHAGFGALLSPNSAMRPSLVVGSPPHAEAPLQPLSGGAVLLDRGKVTFYDKAVRAEEAGASCVIVSQSYDTWPFVMTDSTPDRKEISIPVLMISKTDGEVLRGILAANNTPSGTAVEVHCGDIDAVCSICHDDMKEGDTVVKLSCRHCYHDACVVEWLTTNSSCPMCRHALPKRSVEESTAIAARAASEGPLTRQPYFL